MKSRAVLHSDLAEPAEYMYLPSSIAEFELKYWQPFENWNLQSKFYS